MNTPSHVILNLALLGRQSRSHLNGPIFWGALAPDLALFGFYGWAKFVDQMDEATIWRDAYYEPFWQNIFAVGNSIPIALLVIAIAAWIGRRHPVWQSVTTGVIFLATSAIFHCLEDLPVHADDGHQHFWPLSDFRFASPISYWDPNHHGTIVALVEFLLVAVASIRVWQLLKSPWSKGLLLISNGLMWIFYAGFYL